VVEKGRRCLAVVRIRGLSDIRGDIQDTMKMLNLTRNCQATLMDDRPSHLGMLRKAQSYVTWGEASKESVARLLKERGRTAGNRKLTDEHAQKAGYDSLDRLAEALYTLEVQLKGIPGVKPVFRLRPPKKGFKGTVKKSYKSGGAAGYRGEFINDLVQRMT